MLSRINNLTVVLVIAALIAAIIGLFVAAENENTKPRNHAETAIITSVHKKIPALPRTLAGYKRAFAKLPAERWGGGDISVTTVLNDGRAVWFFGDTLTRRGGHTWLLRNTALVQTGEKMHAVNDGTQILPFENNRTTVYWPQRVMEVAPGVLFVDAAKVHIVGTGAFDFKRVRPNETRTAEVVVRKNGDMKFLGWKGWTPRPVDSSAAPKDGSDTRILGPGHWAYQTIVHHDLPLQGGKHLVTESQNWDNGHLNTKDYRPMFSAR